MAKSKYVWTVDDIEETLNYLYNIKNFDFNSSNYKTLISDILTLESYLDNYYNQFETGDYPSYIEIYKEYKDILNKYKFLQYDIQLFDEKARYIDTQEIELQKNSLSKDDLITITHDFFKSLNPYFYSYFLKNYKICKDHLVFQRWTDDQPYTGLTLFLGTTKEAYISVNRKYDFEDLATTAHEFAHATDFQINPANFSDKNKDVYVEITSILIELLMNDYYYNLTKDKNTIIYKALNHNEFVDMAEDISEFFNLIDIEIKNGQEFQRKKELKINYPYPLESSGIFSNMNINPEIYLISYMFAIEIYELYKKDKEKALDILDKIIKLSNLSAMNYYHKITELAIYPNSNLANFQNAINKDISELYLNKKNKKIAK